MAPEEPLAESLPSGPPREALPESPRKLNKKELTYRLTYAEAKEWSLKHRRQLHPLPLPAPIEIAIKQWCVRGSRSKLAPALLRVSRCSTQCRPLYHITMPYHTCSSRRFDLVDDDGSGTLNASELEQALRDSGIPASEEAIQEIIKLFDYDADGQARVDAQQTAT
jgi:hypothetical protein